MNDNYENLRDWYLARLRRQAIDQANAERLTPMSLVRADAEVVAQIIQARLDGTGSTSTLSHTQQDALTLSVPDIEKHAANWMAFSLSGMVILVGVAIALFIAHPDSSLAPMCAVLTVAILVACASIVVGIVLFNKQVVAQLRSLATSMESNIPPDVAKRFVRAGLLAKLYCYTMQLGKLHKEATIRERAIVDYSPQLVCALNTEGKVKATNPAVMKLLGYAGNELANTFLVQYTHEDDAPLTLRALEAAKRTKTSVEITNRMRTKDKTIVHVQWSVEWSEKSETYYCAGTNVSEKMQLEQLKKDFVEMITHDLRAPLSSMVASSQLIQTQDLGAIPDEALQRLRGIEQTGKRLLSLVSELLDIDRLEAGLLEIDRTDVPLTGVYETAIETLRTLFEAKQITVTIEPTDIVASADELRLIQVMTNLVSNAIKFSPRKSVITISSERCGEQIEIKVKDEGRGIASDAIEKIFDRFKQIEIADSALKGGSGLGLAICKAIVNAHGGEIGVASEVGKGSTFWFRLPANPAKNGSRATAAEVVTTGT